MSTAMAQARLIQGTGDELIRHLERYRHQNNLLLIIPEEEISEQTATSGTEEPTGSKSLATIDWNGVPLLPTHGAAQTVTMELVKRLAEEQPGPVSPSRQTQPSGIESSSSSRT